MKTHFDENPLHHFLLTWTNTIAYNATALITNIISFMKQAKAFHISLLHVPKFY
jgi:hypothetical protein